MQIDLKRDEAETLRDMLRERVTELDREINATDNRRYKDGLRETERQIERILGAVSVAMEPRISSAKEWEPRDNVDDSPDIGRS